MGYWKASIGLFEWPGYPLFEQDLVTINGGHDEKKNYMICTYCGSLVDSSVTVCPGCGAKRNEPEKGLHTQLSASNTQQDPGPAIPRTRVKWLVTGTAVLLVSVLLITMIPRGIYLVPLLFLAAGIYLYITRVHSRRPAAVERRLEKQLLQLLHGDREGMNRLINFEKKRNPGSSRLQQLDNAIYRLVHDRR